MNLQSPQTPEAPRERPTAVVIPFPRYRIKRLPKDIANEAQNHSPQSA
jgi:hypothetical protein